MGKLVGRLKKGGELGLERKNAPDYPYLSLLLPQAEELMFVYFYLGALTLNNFRSTGFQFFLRPETPRKEKNICKEQDLRK